MRILFFLAALAFLPACVTVSVVPQDTSITSHEDQITSPIETAASHFCDTTIDRGWISQSQGLAEVARILVDGRRADQSEAPLASTYTTSISKDIAGGADGYQRLRADAEVARDTLSSVTNQVRGILDQQEEYLRRGDLTSYERALVHAQKSRRSFAEAAEFVGQLQASSVPASVEGVLADYDAEIDRARQTADELAARYANGARSATS